MGDRSLLQYLILAFKGIAMGAADVVPGVSGGTIAFISGIYEELITSINQVNFSLFKTLRTQGLAAMWKQVNGNFLISIFLGIAFSVITLAKLISWLLINQPVLLWSFFFGLVIASIIFVAKGIEKWNLAAFTMLALGAVIAYYITQLPPVENTESLPYLFLSGALAICAMILPGISGAFILVLLGSYKTILDAVHERDIAILATVFTGAIFGILSFAKLLKWMFQHYKNMTLALLTGFIIGSLSKIWPWKEVITSKVFDGKTIPVLEENISPLSYEGNPQLLWAILLAILGFLLIFMLEKLAAKK
jgi:putative membrane protein